VPAAISSTISSSGIRMKSSDSPASVYCPCGILFLALAR
jgi:hypothetical protein